jgi:Ran GTPase-activating protein (RanGAP) involved in mRNA processing and transport
MGMHAGDIFEDVTEVDGRERVHGEEVEAESGGDHADPEVEKSDLLSIIASLPTEDLARCIPPYIFDKVRQASKAAEAAVDEKKLPREFRVNKVWWAASRDSQLDKENFILDKLLERAQQMSIGSIIVPECLKSRSRNEAEKLATALSHCPVLTWLDLSGNRIEWSELHQPENEWNRVKWRCTTLTHLDLKCCDLHYEGLRWICKILEQWECKKLSFLDLSDNKLLNADWPPLLTQLTGLHHLNVSKNSIDNKQMSHIGEGLNMCTTLTHLDMSSNPFGVVGMQSLAPVLRRCTELTHLVLADTKLFDEGVESLCGVLSGHTKLLHLNLSSIYMKTTGLLNLFDSLSKCKSLTYLNLSFNILGVEGTEIIANALLSFPVLCELHLGGIEMQSAGIRHLAGYLPRYRALKHLNIEWNSIGEEGTRALIQELPKCTTLRSLNMRGNHIKNEAQDLVTTCLEMATKNKYKFELTLIGNHINDKLFLYFENQCRGTNLVLKLTGW